MSESSLDKIFRLTGVPVGARSRTGKSVVRARTAAEKVTGGQLQLSSAYRSAWGNVSVGDVLEFGPELWKVIPASSYPHHKKKTDSGGESAALSTGSPPASSQSNGSQADADGQDSIPPPVAGSAHTVYLQDVRHPASYDELTLPVNYVVTIVPVSPA